MLYMEQFGKAFIPQRARPSLRNYLFKAGFQEVPYKLFGGLFYIILLITVICYFSFIYPRLADSTTAALVVLTFVFWFLFMVLLSIFTTAIIYVYLNMKIYNRTKQMEILLPEYLQLVSTNLKGGMSLDKALWSAIQPEFGVLAREVKMVSKRVLTGNDLDDALIEFANKYDSPILSRAIDLIVSEIETGGKIADVIDRVVMSLRKMAILKEEMAAQTTTYMIFVGAIVMLIGPGLFALSSQLISIIGKFSERISGLSIDSSAGIGVPFASIGSAIDVGDFRVFAFFALGIISIFSAMIISIIEKGDIKGGLKYIPIFLIVSVLMFLLFSWILGRLFGGIIV